MTTATTPGYTHTQKAPLCLIVYGSALACLVLGVLIGETPAIFILGGAGLSMASLGPCFHNLTVEDQGDRLAIRFGPVPLFRRTVSFADISSVETGRTRLLDGWGVHLSVRGGWVWNLWDRECVVVHFRDGGTLWIGTDDAANLAEFLRSKAPA